MINTNPDDMLDALDMPEDQAPDPVLDLDEVLKVNRRGDVIIGSDVVDTDTFLIVVDITSFKRGWRCWIKNEQGQTTSVPTIAKPLREVPKDNLPVPEILKTMTEKGEEVDAEWKEYNEFKAVVLDHANGDIGRVVTFAADSGWSKVFAQGLHAQCWERRNLIKSGKVARFPCPVLSLDTREFSSNYGKHVKMVFTIEDWAQRPTEDSPLLSKATATALTSGEGAQAAIPAKVASITESEEHEPKKTKAPRAKASRSKTKATR